MSGKQEKKRRDGEMQRVRAEEIADERVATLPKPKERQNVRHMRRLFGGTTTAEQFHSAALAAQGHRCMLCGGPGSSSQSAQLVNALAALVENLSSSQISIRNSPITRSHPLQKKRRYALHWSVLL